MKTLRVFFGAIFLFSLVAMQSHAGVGDDEVTLLSSDDMPFKVEVKTAQKSETIKNLIEDAGTDAPIPLPNIAGKIFAKIVELMKYDAEHVFESDAAFLNYLREKWGPKDLSTANLKEVVDAVNYLDVKRNLGVGQTLQVLPASLILYTDRLFGYIELEDLKRIKNDAAYTAYVQEKLTRNKDLQRLIESQNFPGINRIFLDNSPDRRIHAREGTPLGVRQIIAIIEKDKLAGAAALPVPLQNVLKAWQGDNFASKIHFGPMPIEWAIWPGNCPLKSNEKYNMYSDNTPEDRFVDNGDGTVTDVCTLLTWEQTPSIPAGPLQQGLNHCAKLDKAGTADWRAPTRIELQSIVNYASQNPALNPVFHEGNARYWSSTPAVDYENQAWTVNFDSGYVYPRARGENHRMRCVRGERGGDLTAGAMKRYVLKNDTVTDNFTGAEWQRRASDSTKIHVDAKSYCTSGWTLPSVKALSTLVDVTRGSPRIDLGAFPGTPGTWFWSGSPRVGDPKLAWVVGFDIGGVLDGQIVYGFRARCVR